MLIRSALVAVALLVASSVAAQVGTEPTAWTPAHRGLADTLGTVAVAGQAAGTTIVSVRAWRAGDHTVAYRAGCSLGVAMAITESLKRVVREWRPDGTDERSWPSGHAAAGAALSGWNFSIGIPIGAFIGLSRANANRHHLDKDVLAGWAFGAAAQGVCAALIR